MIDARRVVKRTEFNGETNMRYRAKSIKNTVKVNKQRSVEELNRILAKLSKEFEMLKAYCTELEAELLRLNPKFDFATLRKNTTIPSSTPSTPMSSAPSTPRTPNNPASPSPFSVSYRVLWVCLYECLCYSVNTTSIDIMIRDYFHHPHQLRHLRSRLIVKRVMK